MLSKMEVAGSYKLQGTGFLRYTKCDCKTREEGGLPGNPGKEKD